MRRSSMVIKLVLLISIIIQTITSNKFTQTLPKCTGKVPFSQSLTVQGGVNDGSWSDSCQSAIFKDFASRDELQEFVPCKPSDSWGPRPRTYPADLVIPSNCDRKKFMQQRVIHLISKFVAKGWNYCHPILLLGSHLFKIKLLSTLHR